MKNGRVERWLLAAEVGAALFVLVAAVAAWVTLQELNEAYRALQQVDRDTLGQLLVAENEESARPDPGRLLPAGGDRRQLLPPLAPAGSALPTPNPIATPQFAQTGWTEAAEGAAGSGTAATGARRLQIPSIGVDSGVFPGGDPRALKLGVGQFGRPVAPGEKGNLVLAAHNDSYGAIFRDLGRLEPGDEIRLSSAARSYTYRVRDRLIVAPDDAWVMLPTPQSTLTLITCYPRPLNGERLVIFADLEE